ncbi:rhomboid family intramembrane serine protease [Microbacteriaceae bacterium VKM Ac-2855]|nr:rhomboid family intramembrane serine protease [Microbacteriaceae bacterium VKM Ac-2855]
MTQVPPSAANVCYRHPDRQSFIRCQRCGRTICPECQTPGAVGVICPDDMAQQRQQAPKTRSPLLTRIKRMTQPGQPTVTYAIIALCVVVWVVEMLPVIGGAFLDATIYAPAYTLAQYTPAVGFEPWRMLTSIFIHSTALSLILPFHLLLNMYTLWIFGGQLESMLGRGRFIALFLISGFAGSVGVLLLGDPVQGVLGASGAIFGLMGAFFAILRHMGSSLRGLLIVVGINLVAGFILPGVAWQAHVGGLVAGALIGLIFTRTRQRSQRGLQVGLIAGVCVLLVAITAVKYMIG